ncbi:hypothetical protein PF003_g32347 [Phytophthora fragariae]|uniref:Uncharacterized protein n=2 Tax=Phytophthora fragariae TaxID=53985 RepID=A0A6A3FVK3_9STRA|nr:hypothetical protein PF003_g32347 [Phytophthora fragariae]KAE8948481.1 hypothetical protein PF009_g1934 [Phytophthora fragariae]
MGDCNIENQQGTTIGTPPHLCATMAARAAKVLRLISLLDAKAVCARCADTIKERITFLMVGDGDGNKLNAFLIFKTKPSKIADTARANTATWPVALNRACASSIPSDVQIYGNVTAWRNSELSIAFLNNHRLRSPNMHEPMLLLGDEFSEQWRTDVLIFARLLNVELLKVPPEYTYVCQPAEVAWNHHFKSRLRQE